MTGTREHAAAALDGDLPMLSNNGSTRIVYIADGVVYKVNRGIWEDDANVEEHAKISLINKLRTLPEGVYIPETTLYDINGESVLAMEYIEGIAVAECYCEESGDDHDDTCMTDSVWQKVNGYLDDTSGFNTIIRANGDIYIIDLA